MIHNGTPIVGAIPKTPHSRVIILSIQAAKVRKIS